MSRPAKIAALSATAEAFDSQYGWYNSQVTDTQAVAHYFPDEDSMPKTEVKNERSALGLLESNHRQRTKSQIGAFSQDYTDNMPKSWTLKRKRSTTLSPKPSPRVRLKSHDILNKVLNALRALEEQNGRIEENQIKLNSKIDALSEAFAKAEGTREVMTESLQKLRGQLSKANGHAVGIWNEGSECESDYTDVLDPNEESQSVIRVRRSTLSVRSASEDPYIPSLDSQIEKSIIEGSGMQVRGRPPCVAPSIWNKPY